MTEQPFTPITGAEFDRVTDTMERPTKKYVDDLPGISGEPFKVNFDSTWLGQPLETEEWLIVGLWMKYDKDDPKNQKNIPCDKYLVCRKDGNIHFEAFNGTGWAYNDKVIAFYSPISNPVK